MPKNIWVDYSFSRAFEYLGLLSLLSPVLCVRIQKVALSLINLSLML